MKKFQILILSLVLSLFCSVWTYSQTEKSQSKKASKIALFFPDAFEDETTGITDLIEVNKNLDIEFKTQADELHKIFKRIEYLQKNIIENSQMCEGVNCSTLVKMVDEYEVLASEVKIKQSEVKKEYEKRKKEVTITINQKITEALKQFGKNNGFAIVLDGSKINSFASFPDSVYDITKEFIKFYNENFSKA